MSVIDWEQCEPLQHTPTHLPFPGAAFQATAALSAQVLNETLCIVFEYESAATDSWLLAFRALSRQEESPGSCENA